MSKHQYAMVMDLNKCIGCQTCTIACKKQWTDQPGMEYMYWNNVETQPGRGYPRGWQEAGGGWKDGTLQPGPLPTKDDYGHAYEYNYEERLMEGKKGEVKPDHYPDNAPNWDEDVGEVVFGENYYFYLPRICNHCTNPACVAACPRGAIYKREEDGIVLIDQERCRGYRKCIQACPYKKIYWNEVTRTSQKCIFCYPRLEKGEVNACAKQCPGRIRFVGLLDDPESPVHKIVMKHEVALPLYPEKGTSPNVFYVPPISPPRQGNYGKTPLENSRIPTEQLVKLFGDKVKEVLAKLDHEFKVVRTGGKSEILDLLIGRNDQVRYRIGWF